MRRLAQRCYQWYGWRIQLQELPYSHWSHSIRSFCIVFLPKLLCLNETKEQKFILSFDWNWFLLETINWNDLWQLFEILFQLLSRSMHRKWFQKNLAWTQFELNYQRQLQRKLKRKRWRTSFLMLLVIALNNDWAQLLCAAFINLPLGTESKRE